MTEQDRKKEAWAILVAAGSGARMAQACDNLPKQFLEYDGQPLYWQSARVFARCACIKGLVFVFPENFCDREKSRLQQLDANGEMGIPWLVAQGGASRRDSVRHGLEVVPLGCSAVLVHDAARPFLNAGLVWRVFDALDVSCAGVVPVVPLVDTIKMVADGKVEKTLPRNSLSAAQTPQIFWADQLRLAHQMYQENIPVTDDASMLENMGLVIHTVPGDQQNVKITNPVDLALLRAAAENSCIPCNGFGYDVHRYGVGRPLKLGGVPIPGGYEVVAHSDGDVLLHALMDALLGCAGLGDIGSHYPDVQKEYDGISSAILLDDVLKKCAETGLRITHIDLTVVAQKPKLECWKNEICKNVARLLNLPRECVNIKATTEEGLGFTGAMEGIKAYALASCLRRVNNGQS